MLLLLLFNQSKENTKALVVVEAVLIVRIIKLHIKVSYLGTYLETNDD